LLRVERRPRQRSSFEEERMEASVAFEVPAVEVRDRLVGFVEEVAAPAAVAAAA
jgi:hypothetical protein